MQTIKMITTDLETALVETTERALARVSTPQMAFEAKINQLAGSARELTQVLVARGDMCPVGDEEDSEDLACRILHFEWADGASHFMVLYRNVQFELQKAALLADDGETELSLVTDLHHRSAAALQEAQKEWVASISSLEEGLKNNPKRRRQALDVWNLQHNPWPQYRTQLLEIESQTSALGNEFMLLRKQSAIFAELRDQLKASVATAQKGISAAIQRADEILAFVSSHDEEGVQIRPAKITTRLDELLVGSTKIPQINQYTDKLTDLIFQLAERMRVTVGAKQGILQYKEVNFRRSTEQWVSAEVLPQLYELWEQWEQVIAGLEVASNVCNRTLLLASELAVDGEANHDVEQLRQPFNSFLTQAKGALVEGDLIGSQVVRMVEADLRLSAVYRPVPGFLPLPMQSGINEFTRRQGELFSGLRRWFGTTFAGLERLRGIAAQEEKLSVSEKVVRVISQRTADPENAAYTNILITKGYIGEAFFVGRSAEKARVRELIANWQNGFRGAIMLTGRRLSGKTLFGELVANRLFTGRVIRLKPHAVLNLDGRRMTTTGDLREALSFIQKHTTGQQPMIWIDDLETWWDKSVSLAENVRELSAHIDENSGRIFYLVSSTSALNSHLRRFMDVDRIFQAEINLDNFPLEDMQQAIRVRHGATHKILVDSDGDPLGEAAFSRHVMQLHRSTFGNIGDTLNRWAWFMKYYDESRVTLSDERRYRLPAFLSADTGILLTTIYLERRTSEYHLRRLMGPPFEQRYRNIIRRLHRVGLLNRRNDGWLEICENVVNDVGRALEDEGYLNAED